MFNNIYIVRQAADGNVMSTVRVPLSYAPKRKYLERIRESPDLDTDTKTAIKLPRMSFEMISFQYDPTRQIGKTNQFTRHDTATNKKVIYAGVPYTLYFQLNVYTKSQEDGLQVIEQIIPYFAPQYTPTIKPFAEYPDIVEDVPITLTSTSFADDYEGALETRRTIVYTLEFEMKTMFYGPIGDSSIIRSVTNNFYLMGDSDTPVSKLVVTPDPFDVNPDSDYGYTETWTDYIG